MVGLNKEFSTLICRRKNQWRVDLLEFINCLYMTLEKNRAGKFRTEKALEDFCMGQLRGSLGLTS